MITSNADDLFAAAFVGQHGDEIRAQDETKEGDQHSQ